MAKMTFQQAHDRLRKMAKDKCCALGYKIVDFGAKATQECSLYVDGGQYFTAPTWEDCFKKLSLNKEHAPIKEQQPGPEIRV